MLAWDQRTDENCFCREDRRKLGSLISTTIQHSLGKALGEIWHKITPTKRYGFKIPHFWQHVNHETWMQTVKNDITPSQKIRSKELHFGMQDEECLNSLKESRWKLREGNKSLMNHHVEPPWRTPVNKRNEQKEKLKTQGESLQWFRSISVIIRAWNSGKKRRWNKWNREF